MTQPISFTLHRTGDLWRLERDGHAEGAYSHLDHGVHEAVQRARTLQESGSPAVVAVMLDDGKRMEIDVEPERENPDLAGGAKAFVRSTPL